MLRFITHIKHNDKKSDGLVLIDCPKCNIALVLCMINNNKCPYCFTELSNIKHLVSNNKTRLNYYNYKN